MTIAAPYSGCFASPVGLLYIEATADGLLQIKINSGLKCSPSPNQHVKAAMNWLDAYFRRKKLPVTPTLALQATEFRKRVWQLLMEIPFGERCSYGDIAAQYLVRFGKRTSPRAVGQAVAANPIWLIIPCHRVICSSGALGGYAGGVLMKGWLLDHEAGPN